MDECEVASEVEQKQREAAIAARRVINPTIRAKRQRIVEAREIVAQRGPEDPELANFKETCENCAEPLSILDSEDIFCNKDCADDWHHRERMRKIRGAA
jgi:hypothetical protein